MTLFTGTCADIQGTPNKKIEKPSLVTASGGRGVRAQRVLRTKRSCLSWEYALPALLTTTYRRTVRSPRSFARQLPSPSCDVSASTTSPRAYFSISERFTRKPVIRTRSESDE